MTVDARTSEMADIEPSEAEKRSDVGTTMPYWRRAFRHGLTWTLLGYAVIRIAGIVVLAFWAHANGETLIDRLGHKFDGGWYARIALNGYDGGFDAITPNHLTSNMAFFPMLPALMRGLATITPLDVYTAGVVIAGVSGLAAAWGLFTLGRHLHSSAAGVFLALLWGALPHALVESMAYSESLFTALAVWSLYATLTRRWLTAGVLCLLAGLTRPTAIALIPVVILAALIAAFRRRDRWRPWAAAALAPLGWLGYLAWVGWTMKRPDGYFYLERDGWNATWDGGVWTYQYVRAHLAMDSAFDFYLVLGVILAAIVLLVISAIDRQPWQLWLYSAALLVISLGDSNYFKTRARFLLPAFPLLIPIAIGLARTKRSKAVTVMVFLAVASAYTGGYLLEVWTEAL